MSAKRRIQLNDADRQVICESDQSHVGITKDKLNKLAAQQLGKPGLGCSTVTSILKESAERLKVSHGAVTKTVKHRGP